MPQYLVLIYEDEAGYVAGGDEASAQVYQDHVTFGEDNAAVLRGGHALEPVATATSIRRGADGTPVVTDGPFAETKEALGGFYLIEAADLDDAIRVAGQVPAPFGGVEVRPIRSFD